MYKYLYIYNVYIYILYSIYRYSRYVFCFNVDFPSFPSQLFMAPRDKAKVLPSTGKLEAQGWAVGTGLVRSCLELTWCLPCWGTNISPFQRHF